jgi:glycosyltransferase involved in cell wall biosynthesis
MLDLALVSGSWPPDSCGVGDYTKRLAATLANRGVRVTCLGGSESSEISGGLRLVEQIRAANFDLVHLQYPTMGFGRSLVPTGLPLAIGKTPIIVTLHEFSTFKKIRRPWFLTFAHFVRARVFTNEDERSNFIKVMRPLRGLDAVIPIASNIGKGSDVERAPNSICSFGLIAPNKGIEQFLDFAFLCNQEPPLRLSLIGAKTEMYAGYADSIFERANQLGVKLYLNLPENEVANVLSSQELAYLPFPGGASAKRGSLLAAQQNGVVVITTHSDLTPRSIRDTTIEARSPAEALKAVLRFRANSSELIKKREQVTRQPKTSWEEIGASHIELFKRVLNPEESKITS